MANRWVCLDDKELDALQALLRIALAYTSESEKNWVSSYGEGKAHKLYNKLKDSQKRIKISSAKGKGAELQKWVCQRISKLIDIPYAQSDDDCLIHSREMGLSGVDVVLRGRAKRRFPFAIECKNTNELSLVSAIKQAKDNQGSDDYWMLVFRHKAFQDTVAIISWEVFESIWKGEIVDE